ncbi:NADH:ubiquinone oxidoreductase [Nanoarchaeota archaeon]
MKDDKPVVGFVALTGCYGCLLSVIFNEEALLEIANVVNIASFPFIKEKNYEGTFDVLFVEGTAVSRKDKEKLLDWRKRARTLVALGACSADGGVPVLKRYLPKESFNRLVYPKSSDITDLEKPMRIDEVVQVDHYLPGCPPDKQQILTFIKNIAMGKKMAAHLYDDPVCVECKRMGNRCLLEEGKMCFGPVTRGGCHAICPSNGLECWGCRGPAEDAALETMIKLLHDKGFSDEEIKKRLLTFAGIRFNEIKDVKEWAQSR